MDFNVSPRTLGELDKVPLYSFVDGLRSLNRMQQADEMNLSDLPSAIQQKQAMRPLELRKAELANETSLAQLPGIRATSELQGRKNREEAMTFDAEVSGKLGKLAVEANERDLKDFELAAQRKMYSKNKEEVAEGLRLLNASKAMWEARLKHQEELEKVRTQGQTQKDLEQMRIDAGKYTKNTKNLTIAQQISKENDPIKKDALLRQAVEFYSNQNNPDKDEALTELYRGLHNANYPAYESAVKVKSMQALGRLDTSAISGLPNVATPTPAPRVSEPTKNEIKSYTMQELKTRYPNATEEQIRAAAKTRGIEIK